LELIGQHVFSSLWVALDPWIEMSEKRTGEMLQPKMTFQLTEINKSSKEMEEMPFWTSEALPLTGFCL